MRNQKNLFYFELLAKNNILNNQTNWLRQSYIRLIKIKTYKLRFIDLIYKKK